MRLSLLLLLFFVDSLGAEEQAKVKPFTFYEGRTGAGNFSTFPLHGNVPLRAILQTIEGDADLYFSITNPNASFFPEDHDRNSCSCGIDYLDIPSTTTSYLSVYGHPFHSVSKWRLLLVAGHNSSFSEGEFDFGPEVIYQWDRLRELEENPPRDTSGIELFADLLANVVFELAHILIAVVLH